MTDDIDGSKDASTVHFGLDGTEYAIDLSAEHADELREALSEFVDHATKVRRPSVTRGTFRGPGVDPKAVRAWARDNGIEVPQMGRVPAEVVAKYQAARS